MFVFEFSNCEVFNVHAEVFEIELSVFGFNNCEVFNVHAEVSETEVSETEVSETQVSGTRVTGKKSLGLLSQEKSASPRDFWDFFILRIRPDSSPWGLVFSRDSVTSKFSRHWDFSHRQSH